MINAGMPEVVLLAHTNHPMLPAKAAKFCTSAAPVEKIMEPADNDEQLLGRVLSAGHESVIEHFSATFGVSGISRVTETQFVRHRIASFSVKSGRYTAVGERYEVVIPPSILHHQNPMVPALYKELMSNAQNAYRYLMDAGVKQEDARYLLPQATATQLMVTMNARELLHFFSKRVCGRAQWEINFVAKKMLVLCKELSPVIFKTAGPECLKSGVCREDKKSSCGLRPHYSEVVNG